MAGSESRGTARNSRAPLWRHPPGASGFRSGSACGGCHDPGHGTGDCGADSSSEFWKKGVPSAPRATSCFQEEIPPKVTGRSCLQRCRFSGMRWKAQYRDLQLVLRQRGARDFEIEIGDGTLTHFHPAKDCDLNTARCRAYDYAMQFARLRSHCGDETVEQVGPLQWEPVESA